MTDELDPDLAVRLRGSGYRLTPQRELILRAVQSLGHATPDEVLTEVRRGSSAVNLSTVYRTLEVLEELGLIRHAHLSDRAPTYHSATGHAHFHIVCRNCHRVTSVDPEVAADFVRTAEGRTRVRCGSRPPDRVRPLRGMRQCGGSQHHD